MFMKGMIACDEKVIEQFLDLSRNFHLSARGMGWPFEQLLSEVNLNRLIANYPVETQKSQTAINEKSISSSVPEWLDLFLSSVYEHFRFTQDLSPWEITTKLTTMATLAVGIIMIVPPLYQIFYNRFASEESIYLAIVAGIALFILTSTVLYKKYIKKLPSTFYPFENLSQAASQGKITQWPGRSSEIKKIIKFLERKKSCLYRWRIWSWKN